MKVGPLWDKEKGSLFFFYAGVASLYSKNSKPASLLRIEIWISQFAGKAKKKTERKTVFFSFQIQAQLMKREKKTNTLPKNRGLKNNNNNNNNTIYVISIDKARRLASKQIKETVIKAARAQNTVNKLLHTHKKWFLLVKKERKNRNRNPPKKERNEKKKKGFFSCTKKGKTEIGNQKKKKRKK